MSTPDPVSPRWTEWRAYTDLGEYHSRWERLEASGTASHGEADFIEAYRPSNVLDAGCGVGRVAIELDRRGVVVEGTDLDPDLLSYARADAPHVPWHHADLATLAMGRTFELIAMPGNVMIFCRVEDRGPIVTALAAHLMPNGRLVAGFSLDRTAGALTLDEYDAHCAAAGLALVERYATWDRDPYEGGDYAVSVHRPKR